MRPSLIDTDILSMFLRNHPEVADRFASYPARYKKMNISINPPPPINISVMSLKR